MKLLYSVAGLLFALALSITPANASTCDNLLNQLNRPTVGNAACVAGKDAVIEEIGITKATASGVKSFTYPQSLTKIGLGDKLELDVIAPDYQRLRAGGLTTGFADAGVGAKLSLLDANSSAVAVEADVTVPSGGNFTSEAPNYSASLDLQQQLSHRFALSGTFTYADLTAPAVGGIVTRYTAPSAAVTLSDAVSSTGNLFVEAFGTNKSRPDGGTALGEQLGLQFLVARNAAFDVEIGQKADDLSRSNFVGLGLGIKL